MPTLLPAQANQLDTTRLVILVGVMIGVAIVGAIVATFLRRRLVQNHREADTGMMEHMRRMVDRGELSREEFEAARRSMIQKMSAKPAPDQGVAAGSNSPASSPDAQGLQTPGAGKTPRLEGSGDNTLPPGTSPDKPDA